MASLCKAVPLVALFALRAVASDEVDPATLYEVSTSGSSAQVKAGQKGKLVLAITAKPGAHVSDDAPMKIELSGTNVKLERQKLARPDAPAGPSPRFEVPFTAAAAGKGSLEAKMTFFICTDKICSRQQKNLSVPVEIN